MFRARIKATGEIANFNTFKKDNGEIMVQKNGSLSFFRPDEVESVEQFGWHTANEKPVIPEGETGICVCGLLELNGELKPVKIWYNPEQASCTHGWLINIDILKYWNYLPE